MRDVFALKAERSLQRSSLLTDDGGWETLSHMTEICPDQAPPPIPHPQPLPHPPRFPSIRGRFSRSLPVRSLPTRTVTNEAGDVSSPAVM